MSTATKIAEAGEKVIVLAAHFKDDAAPPDFRTESGQRAYRPRIFVKVGL